jgi:hypothetical protein
MTDAPISPLRRRMIEDMTVRKFAARTQEGYIRAVKGFSAFLGALPDTASAEDLRRYRLHLVESGVGVPTINHSLTALRFLFLVTLRKPAIVLDMPFVREPRRLPVVLSPQEVARLLDAAPGLKYKAALSVAYGAGLRASEVISLKVCDIDSPRMVIRVERVGLRLPRFSGRFVGLQPTSWSWRPAYRLRRLLATGIPGPNATADGGGVPLSCRLLDAWSRKIVGWSMANHLRAELVLDAMEMAVGQRRPRDVIHNPTGQGRPACPRPGRPRLQRCRTEPTVGRRHYRCS